MKIEELTDLRALKCFWTPPPPPPPPPEPGMFHQMLVNTMDFTTLTPYVTSSPAAMVLTKSDQMFLTCPRAGFSYVQYLVCLAMIERNRFLQNTILQELFVLNEPEQ